MPNHHTLKTDAAAFDAVVRGEKNFEVRKDDRAFQAGDTVTLEYYRASGSQFPGPPRLPGDPPRDPVTFRIGFVLRGGQYGIEPGYVAFSLFKAPVPMPGDLAMLTQKELDAIRASERK